MFLILLTLFSTLKVVPLSFEQNLPNESFVEVFSKGLNFYFSKIVFLILVPFYLIKYLFNVDLKKRDIYHLTNYSRKMGSRKVWLVLYALSLLVIMSVVSSYSHMAVMLVTKAFTALSDSLIFLIITTTYMGVLYMCVAWVSVFASASIIKNIAFK